MASETRLTLSNVKSSAIIARQPDVPKRMAMNLSSKITYRHRRIRQRRVTRPTALRNLSGLNPISLEVFENLTQYLKAVKRLVGRSIINEYSMLHRYT